MDRHLYFLILFYFSELRRILIKPLSKLKISIVPFQMTVDNSGGVVDIQYIESVVLLC